MKTWNAPVISELRINETANGCFASDVEFWFLNDDKKVTPPDPNDPS